MGNTLAYLAIVFWPIVIAIFFKIYSLRLAIILSIFGSYLFLPASFEINLPGIPAFNKATVTTIALFFILYLKKGGVGFYVLDVKSKFILMLFCISPFATALANTDSYMHISGVGLYDGLSQAVSSFLIFIPFLIGAKYFDDSDSQKLIFKALVVACIIYIPFILFEVRMSPQLHRIVYGFFPHVFVQQIRADGFRPVVFIGHGLLVAMFVSVATIALYSLIKAKVKVININSYFLLAALFSVLILTKTYGALLFFVFSFFLLSLFKLRMISTVSVILLTVYLSYPLLSSNGLFPHEKIINTVESFNPDRAQSLQFRFFHEEKLLAHANQKPVFGWSSWGRNRIYDPETFEDLSVTDGRWIITLGTRGWFGFLTEFYFIFIAIWFAFKLSRKQNYLKNEDRILLSGHLLIVTVVLIDQIPNSSLSYLYWFIVGSLYGFSKRKIKEVDNINK